MKFQAYGIKTAAGTEKCSYSIFNLTTTGELCISLYGQRYRRFSDAVRAEFKVENNSDSMTDYFEDDTIRVAAQHPRALEVSAGYRKHIAMRLKRGGKNYGHYEHTLAQLDAFEKFAQIHQFNSRCAA